MSNPKFILTSGKENTTFHTFNLTENGIEDSYKEKINDLDQGYFKERSLFHTFGIAKDKNKIYVSSLSRIGVFDIISYEYLGLLDGVLCGYDTHQIQIDNDLMYICNTSNDALGIFNLKTKENKYVLFDENIKAGLVVSNSCGEFSEEKYTKNVLHLNSVYIYKNSIFVLLSFLGNRPSKIVELSIEDYQPINVIDNFGIFNHDIFVTDNKIYSLSTCSGELIEYDRKYKNIQKHLITPDHQNFWMRGMKKNGDSMYIFLGKHRQSSGSAILVEFDLIEKKIKSNFTIPFNENIHQVI